MSTASAVKLYPHGHDPDEQDRLELQSRIHDRPRLTALAAKSKRVLDLGCGIGSNLGLIRQGNADIEYVGTDISESAIERAREAHPGETFEVMDATDLAFPDGAFDLVFCNLVLWAAGPLSADICKEVNRILSPDGAFYSFEPDGKTLTFHPKKFAIDEIIGKWERKMISLGLDPFVGRKVNGYLQAAGFIDIETVLYPKISVGTDPDRYETAAKNLSGVYLGPGARFFDLDEDDVLWRQANEQFAMRRPEDLILESYYVNVAIKTE
ncbi:MAG: class I SAM-dependent methyltransferase [Pseudomonadota bacterium]